MENQSNQPQPSNPMPKTTTWAVIIVILLILGVGGYFLLKNNNSNMNNNNSATNTNQTANVNTSVNVNSNTNTASNTNLINSTNNSNSTGNTNTTIDISNWNTYTDKRSGLKFMYPDGWKVISFDDLSAGTTFGFRPSDLKVGDESWSAIGVAIRSNPNLLDLKTFYSQAMDFQNPYNTGSSVDSMVLNGIAMTYFKNIPGVITISKLVFPKGGYVVEVWTGRDASYEAIDNLEQIFFEIASQVK